MLYKIKTKNADILVYSQIITLCIITNVFFTSAYNRRSTEIVQNGQNVESMSMTTTQNFENQLNFQKISNLQKFQILKHETI